MINQIELIIDQSEVQTKSTTKLNRKSFLIVSERKLSQSNEKH